MGQDGRDHWGDGGRWTWARSAGGPIRPLTPLRTLDDLDDLEPSLDDPPLHPLLRPEPVDTGGCGGMTQIDPPSLQIDAGPAGGWSFPRGGEESSLWLPGGGRMR